MVLKKITYRLLIGLFIIGFIGQMSCSVVSGLRWKSHLPDEFKTQGRIKILHAVDGTHFLGPSGINNAFVMFNMPAAMLKKINDSGIEYLNNLPSTQTFQRLEQQYETSIQKTQLTHSEASQKRFAYRDSIIGFYKGWQATPLFADDERWQRHRYNRYLRFIKEGLTKEERLARYQGRSKPNPEKCNDISLCSFYGDFKTLPYYFKDPNLSDEKRLQAINFTDEVNQKHTQLVQSIIRSSGSYIAYGWLGALIVSPAHEKIILLYRA